MFSWQLPWSKCGAPAGSNSGGARSTFPTRREHAKSHLTATGSQRCSNRSQRSRRRAGRCRDDLISRTRAVPIRLPRRGRDPLSRLSSESLASREIACSTVEPQGRDGNLASDRRSRTREVAAHLSGRRRFWQARPARSLMLRPGRRLQSVGPAQSSLAMSAAPCSARGRLTRVAPSSGASSEPRGGAAGAGSRPYRARCSSRRVARRSQSSRSGPADGRAARRSTRSLAGPAWTVSSARS